MTRGQSGLWERRPPPGGDGWSHRSRRWGSVGGAYATFDPRSSCWRAPRRPPGRGTRCTASAPWWSPSGRQPAGRERLSKGTPNPSEPSHHIDPESEVFCPVVLQYFGSRMIDTRRWRKHVIFLPFTGTVCFRNPNVFSRQDSVQWMFLYAMKCILYFL